MPVMESPLEQAIKLRNQLVTQRDQIRDRLAKTEELISQIEDFVATLQQGNVSSIVDSGDGVPSANRITEPPNPRKEEVARHVREIIEAEQRPMSRKELFQRLKARGVTLQGKKPEMVLSTMLWRAGEHAGVIRIQRGGYWLKERPWPNAGYDPDNVFD